MSDTFELVQNDFGAVITKTFKDRDGALINLTGMTVRMIWRNRGTLFSRTMTITNAAGGVASYTIQAIDTASPTPDAGVPVEFEVSDVLNRLTGYAQDTLIIRKELG